MRIVCPKCQAAYTVPDALIAPGKRVRCARCNAEWAPLPRATVEAAAPMLRARALLEPTPAEKPAVVEPDRIPAPVVPAHGSLRVTSEPPGRHAAPAARPVARPVADSVAHPSGRGGGATAVWVGWALTIVVLVGLVWAAVAWRGAVMAGWPPSARVYGALGLSAPGPSPASPTH